MLFVYFTGSPVTFGFLPVKQMFVCQTIKGLLTYLLKFCFDVIFDVLFLLQSRQLADELKKIQEITCVWNIFLLTVNLDSLYYVHCFFSIFFYFLVTCNRL